MVNCVRVEGIKAVGVHEFEKYRKLTAKLRCCTPHLILDPETAPQRKA